jgi:K+-sensing histidine kinase KdpD
MTATSARNPRDGLLGYAEALLMVAGVTLVSLTIGSRWGSAPVVLLYLPPVLAAAVLRGLGPSLIAAIAAALAFNFFFTQPLHTLRIHSSEDVVTVVVLLLAGLLTSRLAGSVREQARLAEEHAGRNATIAGLARQLLSCGSATEVAEVGVKDLARVFDCHAVLMSGDEEPRLIASTLADPAFNPNDQGAAALAVSTGEPAGRGVGQAGFADWQFHPIRTPHGSAGIIGLARSDGERPLGPGQRLLLDNLLDQLALAMERDRLESEARSFAATRQRDRVRSVLLASIADDLRPRVDALLGTGRALRRVGGEERALVAELSSEIAALDRYVTRIMDLGDDQAAEPVSVGELTVDLHRREVARAGEAVHLTPREYDVLAELVKQRGRVLTHAHLLRSVWGPAHEKQIDYLRVAIRNLRLKLEADPSRPRLILTEPSVGYRLSGG